MQLTGGRGVDLAFDHLGGAHFIACLRALAPFGHGGFLQHRHRPAGG